MVQLGPTIEEAKRRFGEVKTPEPPTMRERDIGALRAFIEKNNLTEYLPGLATLPEGLYGDPDADTILGSLGIADFIPVPSLNTGINYGLVYGGQEALRDIEKAETGVDYVAPVVGLGLSALEAFPFLKVATKPTLGFLRSVGSKLKNIETDPGTKSFAEIEAGLSPEVREQYNLIRANRFLMDNEKIRTRPNPYRMPTAIPRADEPLIASPGPRIDKAPEPEKVDTSRRNFLKGAAATPVAIGALSNLPINKVIDDVVSAAKPVAKKIPKLKSFNFLSNLSEFKRAVLQSELESQDIDELTDFMSTTPKSLDELSDSQIDEVFEYNYESADPRARADLKSKAGDIKPGDIKPTMLGIEEEIKEQMSDILADSNSSIRDIVEGKEQTDSVLDIFVQNMKNSGYKNSEITEFLGRILEKD